MLTGEKNRLGISDSMWLAAGIAVTVAGAGILAGFWITLIGLVSGFVVIAICAAAIWFQQQSGDRLRRSFAPTALGLAALLYVVFLLTG